MSVSEPNLQALQQRLLSDKQLQAQVQACDSAHEMATLLIQAGASKGVALQMVELLLEDRSCQQIVTEVLDDAALEQVAGAGFMKPPIIFG